MARDETIQRKRSVADFLSLERNVMAASGSVFLVGLGEELWKKLLPKYLEALGAATPSLVCSAQLRIFLMRSISIPAVGLPIVWDAGARF